MNDRGDIEAIKAALSDPRELVLGLGLARGAKRQAGGYLVSCPAHGDRTPSCSVTRGPDGTVRVRCFGCPLSGDVFDLVAAVEHLDRERDFPAVLLRASYLAAMPIEARPALSPEPPEPERPLPLDDAIFAELVAPMLHVGRLDDSALSWDVAMYLEGRGLLQQAQREGWAALPRPEFQASWVRLMLAVWGEATVIRSGLVNRDFDRFVHAENRLVIPWRDAQGRVYTLQRRRLDDDKPKYITASGRPARLPYGVHRLAAARPLVPIAIVEGALDALALDELCARRRIPVVALGIQGVSAWRSSWGGIGCGRQAIVGLDGDKAGEAAVMQIARDLAEQGAWPVDRWRPTGGAKDWTEQIEGA